MCNACIYFMVGSYEGFPHLYIYEGFPHLSICYGGRRQSGCGGSKPSGLLYIYIYNYNIYDVCALMGGNKFAGVAFLSRGFWFLL